MTRRFPWLITLVACAPPMPVMDRPNSAPQILAFEPQSPFAVGPGCQVRLKATVTDSEGETLANAWLSNNLFKQMGPPPSSLPGVLERRFISDDWLRPGANEVSVLVADTPLLPDLSVSARVLRDGGSEPGLSVTRMWAIELRADAGCPFPP